MTGREERERQHDRGHRSHRGQEPSPLSDGIDRSAGRPSEHRGGARRCAGRCYRREYGGRR